MGERIRLVGVLALNTVVIGVGLLPSVQGAVGAFDTGLNVGLQKISGSQNCRSGAHLNGRRVSLAVAPESVGVVTPVMADSCHSLLAHVVVFGYLDLVAASGSKRDNWMGEFADGVALVAEAEAGEEVAADYSDLPVVLGFGKSLRFARMALGA
jgi:hypothetical protein